MMMPSASQTIIVSVILCLTFLNFLMWSKTNYGINPELRRVYHDLLLKNESSIQMENRLEDIRNKLEEDMGMLKSLSTAAATKPSSFDQLFKNMKDYSTKQVTFRQRAIQKTMRDQDYFWLYGAMAPEVFCPEKVRVGIVGDGGKWTCNPWKTPNDSVLFSLGLNNLICFEEDWQRITSNSSVLYGFDQYEQSLSTLDSYSKIRGTARQAYIESKTNKEKLKFTIEDLAKEANVTEIEILKIDIEGAETTCLIPFLEKYKVCQMYIEIHGGAPVHATLLREIGKLKYRLFSYEVNGYNMNACEYSFIHESCVEKYGAMPIATFLDF